MVLHKSTTKSTHRMMLKTQPGSFIEKTDEQGRKRRYVKGICSGTHVDAHNERMNANCIAGFDKQFQERDILLFADVHGIKASEDIGIMVDSEVQGDNWIVEYRLYDEQDGIGQAKLETINTLWKQMNGLPPYTKPMVKGLSIEAYVYAGGYAPKEGDVVVINEAELIGVIICDRPAYQESELTPVEKSRRSKVCRDIAGRLKESIALDDIRDNYYSQRYELEDALYREIKNIMLHESEDSREAILSATFDEFRDLNLQLIRESTAMFDDEREKLQAQTVAKSSSIINIKIRTLKLKTKLLLKKIGGK